MTTKFAGRLSLGSTHSVCEAKHGQYHTRSHAQEEGGKNLAKVLMPGFEYEKEVLTALLNDQSAPPLSVHTSAGVPAALEKFIETLGEYLPWRHEGEEGKDRVADEDDWFVSLQVEGASAVLAAIDLMLQLRHFQQGEKEEVARLCDWRVGVCSTSYHGPPSSSPGANTPLFSEKHNQVMYPAPPRPELDQEKYLAEFAAWLAAPPQTYLGCLLFEPQWGSTAAGRCWHPTTLKKVIAMCHEKRVLVVADEIMCGLGRHGQARAGSNGNTNISGTQSLPPTSTLFLSDAWELPVDAVTFGKAICAGAYPMSGVLCRRGARKLGSLGRSALQSHTYSGSNVRALMTGIEVLKMLPSLFPEVVERGKQLRAEMRAFEACSEGLFTVQGSGLMWGALLNRGNSDDNNLSTHTSHPLSADAPRLLRVLKEACKRHQILPYFVPVGGFMVTPLFDVHPDVISEIGARLRAALRDTMAELA